MTTEILNLLVGRSDGVVQSYFGVQHEGALWLVTAWIVNRAEGAASPERMIRVESYQESQGDPFHYVNILLPKDVLDTFQEDIPGFEVRNFPDSPVVQIDQLKPLPQI